ncbi:MAG TPA: hypothetical protein VGP76_31635 [Planctomycetaceae bacterium]|nr:hypothetical protein [Planctomycetaceae bacterium]
MRPRDSGLARHIATVLATFDQTRAMPGIRTSKRRDALIEQVLESIHRVGYVGRLLERGTSSRRADPNDELFDPLKAAIYYMQRGDVDEAFWMVFLFVHFGKHKRGGWRYAREVYGRLGNATRWDWGAVSTRPAMFRQWLDAHLSDLKRPGAGFGNHRKYQSLDGKSATGTGAAVESYIKWVSPPQGHAELIRDACQRQKGNKRDTFDYLYQSMDSVVSFGRVARFDYLTMVGKLKLGPIEPGSAYLRGATGPLLGARLLFANNPKATLSADDIDEWLVELDARLGVEFGLQVLEDSLCNWQKSPDRFAPFRG